MKKLTEQISALEASIPTETQDEDARRAERERIVAWLFEENKGDTVRAAYGRKLAQRLADGDDQK
jgi:hypothetical protein